MKLIYRVFILIFTALLPLSPVFALSIESPFDPSVCPTLTATMQRGSADARTSPTGQVRVLQKFLASYYGVSESDLVTGYFGNVTRSYVVRFQTERGITPSGLVGPLTRGAIALSCDQSAFKNDALGANSTPTTLCAYFSSEDSVVRRAEPGKFRDVSTCKAACYDIQKSLNARSMGMCHYRVGHSASEFYLDDQFQSLISYPSSNLSTSTSKSAPTCQVSLSSNTAQVGEDVVLSWSGINADKVVGIPSDLADRTTAGSLFVSLAIAGSRTYVFTFIGPGGQTKCSATLTTEPTPSATNLTSNYGAPTCTLTTNKSVVTIFEPVSLTWSSNYATHMTGINGQDTWPTSGTQQTSLVMGGSRTYVLTFVGPGGQTKCSTTISTL